MSNRKAAIVDYGMGNLFSVKQACEHVGIEAFITSCGRDILNSDAVILPGVGAFGDAMDALRCLDLVSVLQEVAVSLKPLLGICLGMQLLMDESYEFGHHKGLGIIKGSVIKFDCAINESGKKAKVPQVGWNRIYMVKNNSNNCSWKNSMLNGLGEYEFMYFNHSFYVKPKDPGIILSLSRYGDIEFCSSLQHKNIFACQFHPERSGLRGLMIYKNLLSFIN